MAEVIWIVVVNAAWLAVWLAMLAAAGPAWRMANRGGERTGRAVAWFCSGGPGWKIARWGLERSRRDESWMWEPAPGSGSYGLAQYAASPHRGGLPGEVWKPHAGWVGRRGDPGYWVAEPRRRR